MHILTEDEYTQLINENNLLHHKLNNMTLAYKSLIKKMNKLRAELQYVKKRKEYN